MSAFPRKPVSELALIAVGAIPLLLLVEWTYSIALTPPYTAGQTHILTSFLVVGVGVLRPRRRRDQPLRPSTVPRVSAVAVARLLRRIHTQSRANGTSRPPIPSQANLVKPVMLSTSHA